MAPTYFYEFKGHTSTYSICGWDHNHGNWCKTENAPSGTKLTFYFSLYFDMLSSRDMKRCVGRLTKSEKSCVIRNTFNGCHSTLVKCWSWSFMYIIMGKNHNIDINYFKNKINGKASITEIVKKSPTVHTCRYTCTCTVSMLCIIHVYTCTRYALKPTWRPDCYCNCNGSLGILSPFSEALWQSTLWTNDR